VIENFDVVIVGAGPAGISAAYILAEKGIKTIVLERGAYPGAKNISGGVLYGHDLGQIIPGFAEKNCPIERNIIESRIWYLGKNGGLSLSYRDKVFSGDRKFNAFTVGRAKFDRWFADQAKQKGVLVVCGTVVIDLLRDNRNWVIGVNTDRPEGEIKAKVVLLADGINSPLAAKTGFRPEPKPHQVALAVKEVIELPAEIIQERFNVEPGQGVTIEILGEITQGMNGVAAIYTNQHSLSVNIGANLFDLSKGKIRPYELIEKFKNHPMVSPLIQGGKPSEYTAHWLAEGGYETIPHLCGDGFLIAGDSGMLFNALHREGLNLAMTSGRLAAEAIAEALAKGDFSRNGLKTYISKLKNSYIMHDLKKYQKFPHFLNLHKEMFTTLPEWTNLAARETLTVNGIPKKEKQAMIWREFRQRISLLNCLRLLKDAWRSVHGE
jgi:electron transfer flavoprotein-quinone oxidoreductase